MKEPIQQSGSEVSIVIYDAPLPPRYLRVSKRFVRTLFIVVPVFIGLIMMALVAFGIGSRIKDAPAPSLPKVISDDEAKIRSLEAEIESLKNSTAALQDKLTGQGSAPAQGGQEEPYLMSIRKPYGMQNLMAENRVTLDQFEYIQDKNKTSFKFQIISSSPDTKVTGHVIVFMVSSNGLVAYPPTANVAMEQGVKFSVGEPFAVSRLRPTNAEFAGTPAGESVKFVIYIFTREGDLLLIKESEAYKIGNRS
jgi:hypothetical protein